MTDDLVQRVKDTDQTAPSNGVATPSSVERGRSGSDTAKTAPSPASVVSWVASIVLVAAVCGLITWRMADSETVGIIVGLIVGILVMLLARWGLSRNTDTVTPLLLAALECEDHGHMVCRQNGQVVYANPAFYKTFPGRGGIGANFEAMLEATISEDGKSELQRLLQTAAGGAPDHAEIQISRRSAGNSWLALSVKPIRAFSDHLLWTSRDVTARRELQAIDQQERRSRDDFLDNLPVGFFSAGDDGQFRYVNTALRQWLGIDEDEDATTLSLADFVLRDVQTEEHSELHPTLETGEETGERLHGEVILKPRQGAPFRVYLRQSSCEDEAGEFLYSRSVVLRDYTAKTNMSVALAQFDQLYRALFVKGALGIVQIDLNGEIVECNRAFLKFLGLHREALVGSPLKDRITREDQPELDGQLSKVLMGALPSARLELRLPGLGGREMTAAVFISGLEDSAGEITGFLLQFFDTTERKHLEIEFTQNQRVQAIGQMAGGMAHDFNNLLTAMIGFCDLLLSRRTAADPDFNDLMQIKQNATRAAELVAQILAFSRRQTLQPKIIDTTEMLSELNTLLPRLIGEKVELTMEHGDNLGLVRVDPRQFEQVVINLAVNARDAMPGGGTLVIRTSSLSFPESITRAAEVIPAGDYVQIEVADSGSGIAKEDISRIFEPFFTTKALGEGTGLGLSTVYGIVRQTGGYIFVDSAPGKGTTFTIFLPVYEASDGETSPKVAPAQVLPQVEETGDLTGSGTILLVEDEAPVRLFAARALRKKGYTVIEADSGESAFEQVQSLNGPLDLIISDVVMPGMDGVTFVRLVRQEMPDVKVIMVSGYTEDTIPNEIGTDPTINFLNKPFTLVGLASRVKEVINAA